MNRPLFRRHSLALAAVLSWVAVACGEESSSNIQADTQDITANKGADKATSCHGTEPFWGIAIDAKTVKWETAGGETRTIENKGPRSAIGFQASFAALYQGKTTEDPNRFLNIIISDAGTEGCSDGMSDEIFPFSVSVLSGTELFMGCCK